MKYSRSQAPLREACSHRGERRVGGLRLPLISQTDKCCNGKSKLCWQSGYRLTTVETGERRDMSRLYKYATCRVPI